MTKSYFYELIKYKKHLFSAIMNEYSNSSLDTTIDPDLSAEEVHYLKLVSQDKKISSFLFRDSTNFEWDYSNEVLCLALLSQEELQTLAQFFGVSLYARDIAHILTRDEVLELKEALGEELYAFAIERGQYLLRNTKEIFGNYNRAMSLVEKIKAHGELALLILSKDWSDRQKEKLNFCSINSEMAHLRIDEKEFQNLYFAVKKILTYEVGSLLYV